MAVSKALRFQILRRDNHTCRYCGRSAPDVKLTVDHVNPEALGGTNDPSNLVTACADCNGGKSATPPDAALVAQVDEDAIRWARARHAAGQRALEDFEARMAHRREFREKWEAWKAGGRPLPLPADWETTVDRFLAAGLPLPLLLDCVDIAMGRKIRADNVFNYMCGVAWNRVAEIDEAARASIGEPSQPETAPPTDDLEDRLADILVAGIGETQLVELCGTAAEELRETGHNDPSALTTFLHVIDTIAAEWNTSRYLIDQTVSVLNGLPESKRRALHEMAVDEARNWGLMPADSAPDPDALGLMKVYVGAKFAVAFCEALGIES